MRGSEARRPLPEDPMTENPMETHLLSKAVTAVDAKLNNLHQKVDFHKEKLDSLHASAEKIDEKIDALRGDTRAEANRLDAKIDGAGDRLGTKIDLAVNRLDGKIDTAVNNLDKKVDGALTSVNAKIDELSKSLTAHQLEIQDLAKQFVKARGVDRVWWLFIVGGVLGVMAHALKWF
jgi:chromosome segregation ATPase